MSTCSYCFQTRSAPASCMFYKSSYSNNAPDQDLCKQHMPNKDISHLQEKDMGFFQVTAKLFQGLFYYSPGMRSALQGCHISSPPGWATPARHVMGQVRKSILASHQESFPGDSGKAVPLLTQKSKLGLSWYFMASRQKNVT